MTILDNILAHKRGELAARQQAAPLAQIQAQARQAPPPRDLIAALRQTRSPALIAEVKRASPSRGLLAPDLDPPQMARLYERSGAAAVSVLTDERFFRGHLDHLRAVRQAVGLPVLRKDFVFDPYQVYEARAAGADAVLLIAALLNDDDLQMLHQLANDLSMAAMIEVHDEAELERALRVEPRLIGINNRDLRTFQVHLDTTARLRPRIPTGITVVAESGIHTRADAARMAQLGIDAILVGEALVTAPDAAAKVYELVEGPRVKVCGITTLDDAWAAVEAGADMLGFNFYPPSPRCIAPASCARIAAAIASCTPRVKLVGVFVNEPPDRVRALLDACGLDLAQLHGDEPPQALDALDGRAFKGIRPASLTAAALIARRYARRSVPPALLVDAHHPRLYGGTGQVGDWTLARALAAEYPILLAGGLSPTNVAAAIQEVRPWGVDVASGVESSPGHKDTDKLNAFIRTIREKL